MKTEKRISSLRLAHRLVLPASGVLLLLLFVTIGAVAVERGGAAERVSQAPAPAAMITLTQTGATVTDVAVKKGQSVVWESQDGREHQLALAPATSHAPGFGENMVLGEAGSYRYVFDQPGTFYYYDTLHPDRIKGTVTVTE